MHNVGRKVARLIVIAVALGGSAFIATPTAAPCCQECEPNWFACVAECGGGPSCIEACDEALNWCDMHCIFCGGGCMMDCRLSGQWCGWPLVCNGADGCCVLQGK
jgi:hypothetical protein